ncbi:hypothetical protein JCM18920_1733 [Cutibacterium acnes JCM 18920]|nr:hypothetical protein JCM18920_1733 [Cutibacterium acnes JCM 18920]
MKSLIAFTRLLMLQPITGVLAVFTYTAPLPTMNTLLTCDHPYSPRTFNPNGSRTDRSHTHPP